MTMTYEQAYNKLDTILESAITNYEIEVLTEGAKEVIKRAGEVIIIAIKKLIELVKNLIKKIKEKIVGYAEDEIKYPAGTLKDAIMPDILKNKFQEFNKAFTKEEWTRKEDCDILEIETMPLAGKVKIDILKSVLSYIEEEQRLVIKNIGFCELLIKLNEKNKDEFDDANARWTKYTKELKHHHKKEQYLMKVSNEIYKLLGTDKKPANESVALTAKQKMAKLLIEAAAIIGDEFDEKDPEIIQDPIDTIPEEKPELGSEQDPDVSGGAGEDLDLEEIKDLVGDDKEAIALLLDESVIIDFSK